MGGQLSAGILLYRFRPDLQVLIGHPGGPFWSNKHEGAWSIPKGIVESSEDTKAAAIREFAEETGIRVDPSRLLDLGEITLKSRKRVAAWAALGDVAAEECRSNTVTLEWPPRSGRMVEFPEIDEVRWCTVREASQLLNPAQVPFLARLHKSLDHGE